MSYSLLRANASHLPLADESVDLIVTSFDMPRTTTPQLEGQQSMFGNH